MAEEEDVVFEEKKIDIDPIVQELAEKPSLLGKDSLCPGCGMLLGLKLTLQVLDNMKLVGSKGCIELAPVNIIVADDPAAVSSAISRSENVLVYAGDGATKKCMDSIVGAARRNENLIYICYNNQGYCRIGKRVYGKSLAKTIPASYSATASISEVADYIKKLKKAADIKGFRFIDLLCPCPDVWGFDSSNTIEVARLGVTTGFWPLYEIRNGKLTVTKKFTRSEPIERFFELQKTGKENELNIRKKI